jgi:hypothetical protein
MRRRGHDSPHDSLIPPPYNPPDSPQWIRFRCRALDQ